MSNEAITRDELRHELEQILIKRDKAMCPATRETYERHCRILDDLQDTLPVLKQTVEDLRNEIRAGNQSFKEHSQRLTIIETEKKTAIGILVTFLGLGSLFGAIAGWFSAHFK